MAGCLRRGIRWLLQRHRTAPNTEFLTVPHPVEGALLRLPQLARVMSLPAGQHFGDEGPDAVADEVDVRQGVGTTVVAADRSGGRGRAPPLGHPLPPAR